jgi:hypothetical protein
VVANGAKGLYDEPALASNVDCTLTSHSNAIFKLTDCKTQLHINIKHLKDSLLVQIIEGVQVFFDNHHAQLLHLWQ